MNRSTASVTPSSNLPPQSLASLGLAALLVVWACIRVWMNLRLGKVEDRDVKVVEREREREREWVRSGEGSVKAEEKTIDDQFSGFLPKQVRSQ